MLLNRGGAPSLRQWCRAAHGGEGGWQRLAVMVQTALLALGLLAQVANAQTVAEFYAGRQITLVVGFNPGGGFDTYARAVAPHMGRHIPGNPAIVIRHQPGAGSFIAANSLYNTSPKDGTEIGLVSETAAIDALLGTVRVQFDAQKFTWIGSAARTVYACAAWHTSPIRTAKDLYEKQLVVGTTGTSTSSHPIALRNVLGLKLKLVGGYAGTAGLMLALERGEIEAMCGPIYDTIKTQRADWLSKGLVRWVIQLGLEKVPALGDAPWVMDMATSDDDRRLFSLIVGSSIMGRPFLAPPGLPVDRKDALRTAFMATMRDPQFLAEMERLRVDVSPIDGAALERFVKEAYAMPKPIVDRAKAILSAK